MKNALKTSMLSSMRLKVELAPVLFILILLRRVYSRVRAIVRSSTDKCRGGETGARGFQRENCNRDHSQPAKPLRSGSRQVDRTKARRSQRKHHSGNAGPNGFVRACRRRLDRRFPHAGKRCLTDLLREASPAAPIFSEAARVLAVSRADGE